MSTWTQIKPNGIGSKFGYILIIQGLTNPTHRAASSAEEVAAAVVKAMRQSGVSLNSESWRDEGRIET